MGSGDWSKTKISLRKLKVNASKRLKGFSDAAKSSCGKGKNWLKKGNFRMGNGYVRGNHGVLAIQDENLAATRIQTAFRAYLARKNYRCMRGRIRLHSVTAKYSVKNQGATSLTYLHFWSEIQAHIRDRRQYMVTEGRIRQKKLEDQLKLEGKLHDLQLQVEWRGGSATMEETLAKIHQREAAALKRERAMAYAFSHQWRANSSQYVPLNNRELGKANWGWSWKERWIAARPWEVRIPSRPISTKNSQNKQASSDPNYIHSPAKKSSISSPVNKTNSSKLSLSHRKGNAKVRKLSYQPAASRVSTDTGEKKPEKETVGDVVSNQ